MQESDFVDPVVLAKLLVSKNILTQDEYDKLVQDCVPDYNSGGAV